MSTQVCCPCIRTGRCEKCCCKKKGCTNCRNPACTFKLPQQSEHRGTILPKTREAAIAQGVEILKEHVFRCDRAAYMNYKLSNDFDKTLFWCKIILTIVSVFSGTVIGNSYFGITSDSWLYYVTFLVSALIGGSTSFFKVCPKYILPALEEKCKLHNEAGAGWQELDIQIRGFLATNTQQDITPQKLEEFIKAMSEKRRNVCKIARPSQKMHQECEKDPNRFKERRSNLTKAYKHYW